MSQTKIVRGVATIVDVDSVRGCGKITYHGTVVVYFDRQKIVLDSGGWRTVTAKLRMNQASRQYGLGYWVWQKSYDWYVNCPVTGKTLDFHDGMVLQRCIAAIADKEYR